MKLALITSVLMLVATAVNAEVFDPAAYGLAPARSPVEKAPEPPFTCEFLRNAVEGPKKVWKCSDGKTRYSEVNMWPSLEESSADLPEGYVKTKDVPDLNNLESGVLMSMETVVDLEECYRSGRHRRCERFSVPSFTHLMAADREECLRLAEGIAVQQYKSYRRHGVPVSISYRCGNDDSF